MKVKIRYFRKRDRWRCDYRLNGVRRRPYFVTQSEAETHKATILGELSQARAKLLTLSRDAQAELCEILDDAEKEGYTLPEAVKVFKQHRHMPAKAFTRKQCFDDFMREKRLQRLSDASIEALDSNVGRFIKRDPDKIISRDNRDSVLQYLQKPEWGPRTFNTYLTALKTFFKWCVDAGRLIKSPAETIKKIPRRQMPDLDKPPAVLDPKPLERFLLAAWKHDKPLLRIIALGSFGGLRPEKESRNVGDDDVDGKQILVKGAHAKDRARRYVEINPTLRAWLDLCPKIKPIKNFRRRWEFLRTKAGLIRIKKLKGKQRIRENKDGTGTKKDGHWFQNKVEWIHWGHDCLRHTFASNYLPVHGAEKTIEQLGHGDYDMLFGHYRALRSKNEAEAFWRHFLALAKALSAKKLPARQLAQLKQESMLRLS